MIYVDSNLAGKRYVKGMWGVHINVYALMFFGKFAGLEDCKTQENETQKKSSFLCNFPL